MKKFLLVSAVAWAASAQSIGIIAPTANQSVVVTPPALTFTLKCSVSSTPSLYEVDYAFDGDVPQAVAYTNLASTCPSATWNPYNLSNGMHTLVAVAKDAKGATIATSSAVSFSVSNPLPQQTSPATTVSVINGPAPQIIDNSSAPSWSANTLTLKTSGTSVVSQAVAIASNTSPGTSLTTSTFTSVAGTTLVVFAVGGNSTGFALSNTLGTVTWTHGTYKASDPGRSYPNQWWVGAVTTGAAGDAITVTYTGGETNNAQIYAFSATNISVSPIDGDVQGTGGGVTMQSAPIPVTQTGEVVFFGTTWNHQDPLIVAGTGYTVLHDSLVRISAAEYAVMPSSANTWLGAWGITPTVSPNTGTPPKTFTAFVDGATVVQNTNVSASSSAAIFDTSTYQNIAHQVVVRVDGPNCSGCIYGIWSDMGAWEQRITFANPVVASELRLSAKEAYLCVSRTSTCHYPPSVTLTGTILNTDGSTSATSIVCGAPSSSAVTQSGCTFTAASNGYASFTATATNGMTRTGYLMVMPQDGIPHFTNTGQVRTAFLAGTSMLRTSQFVSGGGLLNGGAYLYPASKYGPAYAGAGFTTAETGMNTTPPDVGTSQSTFQTNAAAEVSNVCNAFATYGLKAHLIGDNWFRGSNELSTTMLGPGASWSPSALTYYMSQWLTCAISLDGVDEVTSAWGYDPLQATNARLSPGSSGLTSITLSGTSGTVNCSTCSINGSTKFIITGDTGPCASALNYNPTTNANLFSASGSGNFTFTTTTSCTGSASSSAVLHPYVNYTWDGTHTYYNGAGACPPGGPSNGPCPNYIPDNAFYQIRSWHAAAGSSGGPAVTWPPPDGASGLAVSQWCGKDSAGSPARTLADYCTFYFTPVSTYLPTKTNLSVLQNNLLGHMRTNYYPSINFSNVLTSETAGVVTAYSLHGYDVSVASCSGDTITFTGDHGLRNKIPGNTRLQVIGSSNNNCDGVFYVWSIPDSTHLRVNRQNTTVTASASSGTITWQDGTTTPVSSMNGIGAVSTDYSQAHMSPNVNLSAKRGMTFTISGSGTAFDGVPFGWDFDVTDGVAAGVLGVSWGAIRQMANFTASTGGTAYILPNNSYIPGPQNFHGNSDLGPTLVFASQTTPYLLRVAGTRQYSETIGTINWPDYYDRTGSGGTQSSAFTSANFNANGPLNEDLGGVGGGVQAGLEPVVDYADTFKGWVATANATLLLKYLANSGFLLQPSLNSPDYGPFFEAAARSSIVSGVSPQYGNLLMIQSYADNTENCAANLGPYLITGQPIYRYYATWYGISLTALPAGTSSDTMTCEPGSFRAYVFPSAGLFAPQTESFGASLSDVPNATDIVVRYAYNPLAFDRGVMSLASPFKADLAGASATLPVDRGIGPVYYQLVYLNAAGAVIATSDVQIL